MGPNPKGLQLHKKIATAGYIFLVATFDQQITTTAGKTNIYLYFGSFSMLVHPASFHERRFCDTKVNCIWKYSYGLPFFKIQAFVIVTYKFNWVSFSHYDLL